MLFAERPAFQVALLENRLLIGHAGRRRTKSEVGNGNDTEVLQLDPASAHLQAWQPAVAALAKWLREKGLKQTRLQVVLSSHLVRWQLLEWQPQLASPLELDAYVQLRFRATFGPVADGWRVVHSQPQPGRPLLACAIDEALLAELQALQAIGETTVSSVVPYFSAAFDRWRSSVGQKLAWFGVAEPGSLTLGLLQRGVWHGLRSARHADASAADWRNVLPALQAQIQLASALDFDLDKEPPTLYLVGCGTPAERGHEAGLVWLAAEGAGKPAAHSGIERMAWGI